MLPGVRNEGLLADGELAAAPERTDWAAAAADARDALAGDPRATLRGLGYDIRPVGDGRHVLADARDGSDRAVAVFPADSGGWSPVAPALAAAERRDLPFVIEAAEGEFRLYATDHGAGSAGRADTRVAVAPDRLAGDGAGYLWVLFSAGALAEGGTLRRLRERSAERAAALRERLRERVHETAVPDLAAAIVDARGLAEPDRATLDDTYRDVLELLYWLLLVARAESAGLLDADVPSLAAKAADLRASLDGGEFGGDSYRHWDDTVALADAVAESRQQWGSPEGESPLSVPDALAADTDIRLTDARFGPVLAALLLDDPGDGRVPLPFGDLGVRAVGAIHEELLASGLSVADRPLAVEGGQYVPAEGDAAVAVEAGEVYLRGDSGERKAAGTYYTDSRFVEHVLDHALDPALDDHIDRIDRLRAERPEAAAEALFAFRVLDPAMGTGQFLVAALDRIAARFRAYLAENPLPPVAAALDAGAGSAAGRGRRLRHRVARECVYGVDRDPLATDIACLSVGVQAAVPGLPPATGTLVAGDSLAGVGTPPADTAGTDCDAAGARARFDVLAAARIDDGVSTDRVWDAPDPTALDSHERAREVLADVRPVHFPAAFPDVFGGDRPGFDAVVGNPPWEEAVLEEDEFWARHVPGLQSMSPEERERRTAAMRERRPDLVAAYEAERVAQQRRRRLLRNGPFPGMGTGDPDTYKAFCWRCWRLARDGGHVGLVLPRSALVAAGSEQFRRTLLSAGTVSDITLLQNRGGWVFEDVTDQYTVALLAARKSPPGPADDLPIRGPFPDAESYRRGVEADPHTFDVERASEWTGTASFPSLPTDGAAVDAFERQSAHPPLREDAGGWRARPATELHATGDRTADDGTRIMRFGDPPPGHWPVFTGASFEHWVPDTGERYAWTDPRVAAEYLQRQRERSYRHAGSRSPFAAFPEQWVADPDTLPCRSPRIAFRDVARATDRRTVIPALVPPETALTNKAPYLLWPRGDERDEAYLLGVLASVPFDWYARRFVEVGVNFHILTAVPVPRPGGGALRRRVADLAGRLAAVDGCYAAWADAVGVDCGPLDAAARRERVHELDAVVAHLYGLSRAHVEAVFGTFDRDRGYEERLERVLGYYQRWADCH